jgi:protein-glutamine gamma-glutamyltransferase
MKPPSGAAPAGNYGNIAPSRAIAALAGSAAAPAPRVVQVFFEFSLLGMLAAGYLAVVASGYLDWPAALLTLAGLCLRALMAAGVLEFQISGRWVAALTLLYAGFYSIDYYYVSASFLKATVHLVFFLAVMKLLTARTDRDYTYLKMIATLELLAAAVLSANVSFFAFLALFLLFAIATFASGEVRRSAQLGQTVVRGGLKAFPRRIGILAGFLFAGVLIMTAGMFFVLPRTARAALERFVPQRYHLTGFSNVVTLGDIGEIKKSSAPVMHVRSYQGEGLLQVRWRGTALSDFDGRQWSNPPGGEIPLRTEHGVLRRPWAAAGPGHPIIYQVHLNEIASDTLFIAGTPETISINLPVLDFTKGGSFHVPRRFSSGALSYGVYSFLEEETPDLRPVPEPLPMEARLELLRLPRIDRRIQRLARDMAAGATTESAEARQIENRLRNDYGYTLDLPSAAVADPLANFLFVRKKGHCEYFASAMAVMLRSMGIPSRVVTGFQSGVYNPMTGWQVVRASDAHSWVEAWISDRGWTTFDPTPFDPRASRDGVTARLYLYFDAAEQFWQDWVLSYDLDRQIVLAARMDESARRLRFRWLRSQARRLKLLAESSSAYAPWLAALSAFGIATALCGPAIKRWVSGRLRFRRLVRGKGEASDATLLYQRMLVVLERRGIRKPPWLTPAEFVRVLPSPDLAALANDLTGAYNEFRFGGRREAAPHMLRLLEQMEKL